jgi:hypothetical protein
MDREIDMDTDRLGRTDRWTDSALGREMALGWLARFARCQPCRMPVRSNAHAGFAISEPGRLFAVFDDYLFGVAERVERQPEEQEQQRMDHIRRRRRRRHAAQQSVAGPRMNGPTRS